MTRRPGASRAARAACAVAALGVLAGCGSGGGKVAETADGRVTVSGTGPETEVTVHGDQGSTVTYGTGSVPPRFPAAVPRPERTRLGTTASGTRGGRQFFQLDYLPAGSGARALTAYRTRLTDAGFTVTTDSATMLEADRDGWRVRAVAPPGSRPTLAVTVTNA
jgi:hypothetical protein